MSELLAIGISHKTAPVVLRERLALPEMRAETFLRELLTDDAVQEAVAVSTCNRTELYLVVGDAVQAESAALSMLARQAGIRPTELAGSIYAHRNCEAARHLYRVVCGLDSMLIGEAEIQGQVRRAYEAAVASGTAGAFTHRLFGAALQTGKRVRTETALSVGQLSLPGAAVALMRRALGSMDGRQVVIIGTGETSELTARALAVTGAHPVFVASRRRQRAISLAQRFDGTSIELDRLPEALVDADVVVSATASPHLLLEVGEMAEMMAARDGRELLLVDLAVPRDIDSACADLPGVTLHDIDDLQAVAARNRRGRQGEARRAEAIIEAEITRFAGWLGSLEVLPTLAALREHAAAIADGVLADNAERWETASERDRRRIDALAHTIVNRLLHTPTLQIKQMRDDRVHARMAMVRDLFGLQVQEAEAEPDASPGAQVRELPDRGARPAKPRAASRD
jgi:glutamyl-tRNA reductase